MPGKRIEIDDESWPVLQSLAQDRMMTFQELADEAFTDLLRKHGRPVGLKASLKKSVAESGGRSADIVHLHARKKRR
jgi:hypothetical protein